MLITKSFKSNILNKEKSIRIFVPESSSEPYFVLYMYDGQNLFNTNTSAYGDIWDMDTQVKRMIKAGIIPPLMIVGIDSSNERLDEYVPFNNDGIYKFMPDDIRVPFYGHLTNQFIVEELIPYINSNFKTNDEFNYIAGSSLGGLMALHAGLTYPETFKSIGVFSLAAYFNNEDYKKMLQEKKAMYDQKYYICVGSNESGSTDEALNEAYINDSLYLLESIQEDCNYYINIVKNAKHTESFWASQIPSFLTFIFNE